MLISTIIGFVCLPVFCLGCAWLSEVNDRRRSNKHIFDIVNMYTPNTLNLLAPLITEQHKLFLKACLKVNNDISNILNNSTINSTNYLTNNIFPNVTLIDVLKIKVPVLRYLSAQEFLCKDKNEYLTNVYNEYINLGGQPDTVIYGLPEYIALILDLTPEGFNSYSDNEQGKTYFKLLATPTQLRDTVLMYGNCNNNGNALI